MYEQKKLRGKSEINRTDGLLGIVLELQRKGKQRAEDLAATFETSMRTIYRDVQALCALSSCWSRNHCEYEFAGKRKKCLSAAHTKTERG